MIGTLLSVKLLKKKMDHRWDGNPSFPYFSPENLGIKETNFFFFDGKYLIDGSKYFVEGVKPKALVCLFHGIGSGRNAYMMEIARLCKEGYLVYAYDCLGCMRSEGKGVKSLGRVYETQRKFFEWIENDEEAKGLRRFAYGHSWGGYQSMLALNPKYKIEKCVSLAGFLKPSSTIVNRTQKHKKLTYVPIALANRLMGGKNSDIDARKMIRQSKAKLLYIVGSEDPLVPHAFNGDVLNKEFGNDDRFKYVMVHGSKHQVMYTHEAENYLGNLLKHGIGTINCPDSLKMDIHKATTLDEKVMSTIFDFLRD